jgi:hypothetical protein
MRYSITLASTVVSLALGVQAQNNWGADVTEGGAWGVSTAVAWGGSPTATAAGSASTDASAITAPSGAECVWREYTVLVGASIRELPLIRFVMLLIRYRPLRLRFDRVRYNFKRRQF